MRAGASSIATTPITARGAKAPNSKACSSSARRSRSCGAQVEKDLKRRNLARETVLAAVVRLLDTEHIRIGNEEYAPANKSYGATTLRSRHLKRTGQA